MDHGLEVSLYATAGPGGEDRRWRALSTPCDSVGCPRIRLDSRGRSRSLPDSARCLRTRSDQHDGGSVGSLRGAVLAERSPPTVQRFLRWWIRQAERDEWRRPGPTTGGPQRVKELGREKGAWRRASAIRRKALALFAQPELRPPRELRVAFTDAHGDVYGVGRSVPSCRSLRRHTTSRKRGQRIRRVCRDGRSDIGNSGPKSSGCGAPLGARTGRRRSGIS